MSDLISRQAALDTLKGFNVVDIISYEHGVIYVQAVINAIYNRLNNLPSAEPERKKGKWVVTSEFEDCRYVKCNQCKVTQVFYYNKPLTNFCPNCGADMRKQDE